MSAQAFSLHQTVLANDAPHTGPNRLSKWIFPFLATYFPVSTSEITMAPGVRLSVLQAWILALRDSFLLATSLEASASLNVFRFLR